MARICIRFPTNDESGALDVNQDIADFYQHAKRNKKSGEMLKLLQGGMFLKKIGLLDASVVMAMLDSNDDEAQKLFIGSLLSRFNKDNPTPHATAPCQPESPVAHHVPPVSAPTDSTGVEVKKAQPQEPAEPVPVVEPVNETLAVKRKINREGGLSGFMEMGTGSST
ncbi:hypothetical protein [Neptunomonas phycophila]|uniref:hypothetical protein n=2 Tax=Neptunomonas phycophila TaxID=1572645 RepID=UPI003518B9B0